MTRSTSDRTKKGDKGKRRNKNDDEKEEEEEEDDDDDEDTRLYANSITKRYPQNMQSCQRT